MNPATAPDSPSAAGSRPWSEFGYRTAVGLAVVAGVFSLLVFALLLGDYSRRLIKDPLDSQEFQTMKDELAALKRSAEPGEQSRERAKALTSQLRDLDLELRQRYFRQRQFTQVGGLLLLGGVLVFLGAARAAVTIRRRLPQPTPAGCPQDHESQAQAAARWAVVGLAAVLVVGAVALVSAFSTGLPRDAEELAEWYAPPPYPSDQEIHKYWPRFRGPDGSGISAYANIPTSWDGASGKGILWKTPVPLGGHNSPIVWGDRIFLSGADKDRAEVYCFDTTSGKLLWQKPAPGPARPPDKPLELDDESNAGWAAPTMATDGRRALAIFPVGELVAFDFEGKQVWNHSFGVPVNSYGHAASLAMYRNLLLVQLDQGSSRDGLSRLYALDAATGKQAWEVKRDVPNSWSSPTVANVAGRAQLITAADPWAIAYDPATGAEIWRAKCLRQDVGPSPVVVGNVVYTVGQAPCLSAIRAEGQGDISGDILWTGEDGLSDTCSPIATAEYVILLTSEGTMTCYDAKQGKKLWEQDFDATFQTSPSLVGNRLYLFAKDGKCWIVEPGPTGCKKIAECSLGEGCSTCPALQDGRMYVRGKKHLICIGNP